MRLNVERPSADYHLGVKCSRVYDSLELCTVLPGFEYACKVLCIAPCYYRLNVAASCVLVDKLQYVLHSIPQLTTRHILHKMLLPIAFRPPQIPRHDVHLDHMSPPRRILHRLDNALTLIERRVNPRPS